MDTSATSESREYRIDYLTRAVVDYKNCAACRATENVNYKKTSGGSQQKPFKKFTNSGCKKKSSIKQFCMLDEFLKLCWKNYKN